MQIVKPCMLCMRLCMPMSCPGDCPLDLYNLFRLAQDLRQSARFCGLNSQAFHLPTVPLDIGQTLSLPRRLLWGLEIREHDI